ncbi:MAG TPA: LuxR family transcriptional regulator [Hyphomonas sp.]|nr:LuxR family transcriptional regulator [Hyphomonas sp.]MCA8904807.1 LuxR family transcriptional regulator [Hyphomonas sp.]MCB9972235.1 LuxR family transcriptional regulator [Hyphomonas sp.]HPE49536.1 LuxR family transcriptional regulator [Hyphomonas sp.]
MSGTDLAPIFAYVDACAKATRLHELGTAARDYYRTTPLRMTSYHHYPVFGSPDVEDNLRVVTSGFPEDYVREYNRQKMWRVDPLVRLTATATAPFLWSEGARDPSLTDKERTYLDWAFKAKLGDGVAIPVFGPRGRNGYCGMGFGVGAPRPAPHVIAEIHWACQIGHLAYCGLISRKLATDAALSAREKEILGWIARGQTNNEIAETLHISRNTVETYIRRCYDKLDVTDRVSAALRGLALGMVD